MQPDGSYIARSADLDEPRHRALWSFRAPVAVRRSYGLGRQAILWITAAEGVVLEENLDGRLTLQVDVVVDAFGGDLHDISNAPATLTVPRDNVAGLQRAGATLRGAL